MAHIAKCLAILCLPAAAGFAAEGIPRFVEHGSNPGGRTSIAASRTGTGLLPLYFEKQGSGHFLVRTPQAGIRFEPGAARLRFGEGQSLTVRFPGSRKNVEPAGERPMGSFSNYFLGVAAPAARREHYSAIRYPAMWRGIDLLYYGENQSLEYDFQVAPKSDPSQIRMRVEGGAGLTVDQNGDLWIGSAGGRLRHHRPVIYQEVDGRRREVAGGYRLHSSNEIGFWLGDYDRSLPLTIDPVLDFSTFLGGQGFEVATGIAVDGANNIYVTGYTESGDFQRDPAVAHLFPVRSARSQDAFLIKLDGATKRVVYANFYGGTGFDQAISVAVDATGAATIVGITFSTDLPLVNALLRQITFDDTDYGFAARFSPDGSQLTFSTYTVAGQSFGVAATSSGSVYVVGGAYCLNPAKFPGASTGFVPTAGAYQSTCSAGLNDFVSVGYILRLGTSGQKEYATYFTPAGGSGFFNGLSDVGLDRNGNVYVTGSTPGNLTVPRYTGSGRDIDCEISKFDSSGQFLWTRQIGGERDEEGLRIAVDSAGNAYATGYTTSQILPVTAGAFQQKAGSTQQIPNVEHSVLGDSTNRPLFDAFVTKVNTQGQVLYTSYLGGTGDDYGWGIAADTAGRAYVTGYTNSQNFPITAGAYQTTFGGGPTDAYVVVVATDGKLLEQATFLGGRGKEEGYQVALDSDGNLYFAGATDSSDLTLTPNAVQSVLRGADALVAKLNIQPCDVTLSGTTRTLPSTSGISGLSVTATSASCAWTLTSQAPWIQLSPSKGNGSTKVAVTVAENTSTESRLGVLTINGRRAFLYQDGKAPCRFLVAPGELDLTSSSERRQISIVTSDATCQWTAKSDQDWVKVLSDASGSGSGSVTIGTDPNDSSKPRTATLTIGDRPVSVGQSAGGCSITTSSESGSFSPAGGLGAVRVLASSDTCPWKAQSLQTWISILTGDSGFGTGRVRFGVAKNDSSQIRTGMITVGDQRFTVTQEQVYTSYREEAPAHGTISSTAGQQTAQLSTRLRPRSTGAAPRADAGNCGSVQPGTPVKLDPSGSKVTLSVKRTLAGCQLTAISRATDWMTVNVLDASTASPRLEISATANLFSQPRNGEVTANSGDSNQGLWHLQVTQDGTTKAPLALAPNKTQLQADGGQAVIQVNTADGTPCDWNIDNPPNWIQPAITSGPCGTSLILNYDRNLTSASRQGAIRFNTGDEVQVEQQAAPEKPKCTFAFQEKDPIDVTADGGQVTFHVAAADGCTWTANSSKEDWTAFPEGRTGSGSQDLKISVGPNDTTSIRMASITVDQATAYVREAAAKVLPKACTYSLSPGSANFSQDGGSGSIQVTTTADCAWQASTTAADQWVKISGGASGTGAGTVSFSVDPNPPGGSARSSNIAVQGNNFKVTQDPGPPPPPSTISANPNPITNCNSQGLGKTTITWSTAAPGTIQVRIGKIDGALFAGGSEGTQETGEFFSSPATLYLVQDGSIVLAQTTVTTACGVLLKPTGKLQASPNPLPICSPQTSGNVTLSWTTTDVTAVAIRRDTFNGTVAASGAASGSATLTVTPPATLLLVDASAGATPTAERVLDRVTVTAGACTNQAGTAPPATDLAESITDWTMEFLAAGKNARGGSQTIDDKNFVVSGAHSLYLYSDTADQIRLTRTIPGSGWDLSKSTGLEFTILSSVPAGFWKAGSPNVRLTSANGSLLIAPTSDVASLSAQNWLKLTAPIAGNSPWQTTATGQFDPKNVTGIQISFDVTGFGWDLILDGVFVR